MGFELLFILGGLLLGIVIGYLIGHKPSATGIFRINETDPNADFMSLHIDDLDDVYTKKYVLLKVVKSSDSASK